MMPVTFRVSVSVWFAALFVPVVASAAQEPIAEIAVISNPYITTLPAGEIRDENGSVRAFLAKTAPDGMEKTVELVNSLQPDALVVLGSLTWSGSDSDFAAVAKYLDRIDAPKFIVPGHRDRLSGSLEGYLRALSKHDVRDSVKSVKDVALAFTSDLHTDPDSSVGRLDTQLAAIERSRAVLLFADLDRTMGRSRLTPSHDAFYSLVEHHHVAVRISPTRYGHRVGYEKTLPLWTVGSTGWSTRGAVTLIRVFEDRVEMAEVAAPTQQNFTLTIPNPIESPRMPSAEGDPFGSPSYSEDLRSKPDFTIALVSDPQFDRERNRDYLIQKAEAAIRDLNRLNPAIVVVAGDLVNNNLPEEWQIFNRVFGELKPPHHVVPGNHDVLFNYDFVEASYLSAPERNPEYAEIVRKALAAAEKEGFTGPAALYEKHTGSPARQLIEHGNCALITVPFLTTRADADQLSFLQEQLRRTRNREHVFVVAHYPSLPAFGNNLQPQLGGTEVLSLLSEFHVTGYLFGHRHRNGFRMHERTAHVLTDNMSTIHLLHVFEDRVIVARKTVGVPLYEKMTLPSPRR